MRVGQMRHGGGRLGGGVGGVADETRGGVRGILRMCGMGRDENGGGEVAVALFLCRLEVNYQPNN